MVIVEIEGGLGNQMFQYAFGRALSIRLNVPLYLTANVFEYKKLDNSNKKIFYTNNYFLSSDLLTRTFMEPSWKNALKKFLKMPYKKVIIEDRFTVNHKAIEADEPVYLKGFWQSENYFKSFQSTIRKEFSFITDDIYIDPIILSKIIDENSVSVHIRRGDYFSNPDNFKKHGLCSIDYFERAFKVIERSIEQPTYIIFTDDPNWVEKHFLRLREKSILIKDFKEDLSWVDMYLMSICKHNIIANSTFSWWGGWLNKNEQKLVIAPEKWFASKELNDQTKDLIPKEWIRV